ncbi:MAG: hypothetical protein UX13_C0023G0008 [Candidatus Woesebacteria bacterium GW2011_GWB1_45_5]|uniref:Alpha-(1->3)-arabinofuranosyltransferase N-terminal GT-C domain-containing protein n=1 Tax=Candidatus Woesebacteria bacterium GW2011_GWB1_45_5 TaxID=1618581 RepID=A0A0G1PX30_9BACT|nr:MAG: hypothetical protein UX13_C0023G0008 [Candidatus Woesebacteria bacterium GW2011_GWB1_45_5]
MKYVKKYWIYFILLSFSLIPVVWFFGKSPEVLINGVDTNFPLNPLLWFLRRFFVWSPIPNAGTDFSSSTAGIFFHLVQVVPYVLNLSLRNVEIVSLIFWFAAIIVSSFLLARKVVPENKIAQLVLVVFYSFNTYIFNTWENVKVSNLSLFVAIPLAIALLIHLNEKKETAGKSILYASLVAIFASGTGINPSYFFSFLIAFFLFFLGDVIMSRGKRIPRIRNFLFINLVVLLVNSFWILPTARFVVNAIPSSGSIGSIGFNNWIESLSENTDIFNVMRLQGAWDWYSFDKVTKFPIYIPYALNYFYRLPFIIFSLALPALSLLSLVFRDKTKNNLYLSFSLMVVLGIFLGAGVHPPTGIAFRFLLQHVPFFSLFRSPWYIFTPILITGYAGLAALLFDYLANLAPVKKTRLMGAALTLSGVLVIVANLVYCYPLITGKIYRAGRNDSFFVEFPGYIFDLEEKAGEQKELGRTLSYPDNEIQEFRWGYRGIESILQLITNRPVLFSPLNVTNEGTSNLIRAMYVNLKRGKTEAFLKLARKLNTEFIFDQGDVSSLSPKLSEEITKFDSEKYGLWTFYRLPETTGRVYLPQAFATVTPDGGYIEAISDIDPKYQIIRSDDSVIGEITSLKDYTARAVAASNSQVENLKSRSKSFGLLGKLEARAFGTVDFEFDIPEGGVYSSVVEGYSLPARFYSKGHHKLSLPVSQPNLISGGDFEQGRPFQTLDNGDGNVDYKTVEENGNSYLFIRNTTSGNASAEFYIENLDPFATYYVELRYKQLYGDNGLVVVTQETERTLVKSQEERLPNYPEWNKFNFYFTPVETESKVKISLVAHRTADPLGTTVMYDDLVVRKVFINNLVLLKDSEKMLKTPQIEISKENPVMQKGTVKSADSPHVIVFAENFSPDWSFEIYDEAGSRLDIPVRHFTINAYANAWYIEGAPSNYSFKIYYKPQTLFNLGMTLSLVTLASGIALTVFSKRKND